MNFWNHQFLENRWFHKFILTLSDLYIVQWVEIQLILRPYIFKRYILKPNLMSRSTSLRTIVLLDDSLPKILSFYSYFNQSHYSQIYNSIVNVWKIYWRSGFPSCCAGFLADAQGRSFRFYKLMERRLTIFGPVFWTG